MVDGKKIAFNTVAIYLKVGITTIVTLLSTRWVLLALGQSDYGLYGVLGSLITILNTIGVAMATTTRRFINVEMGKGENGNPNKIFNISLVVHIAFAILFLLIAETIGIWYINNYLNVEPEKMADAHFVFQVSTIVACIGLVNIPYQSLFDAFQKFWQSAIIDVLNSLIKLTIAILLVYYSGNGLRFYALGMSLVTVFSFIAYRVISRLQWKDIIKHHFFWDKKVYKEIVVFNNYTAIGAAAFMGRSQGSAMIINFFFGTLVNGAFAVANQLQAFTQLLAGNIGLAAAPQITQSYSKGEYDNSYSLCSKVTRYTILIVICIVFTIIVGLDALLAVWLKEVPEGAPVFCFWVLVSTLISSLGASLSTYIQATGNIKWFQIYGSLTELLVLPVAFVLFKVGFAPETILILFCIFLLVYRAASLVKMKQLFNFPLVRFIKETYMPTGIVILALTLWCLSCPIFLSESVSQGLVASIVTFALSVVLCFYVGLLKEEREIIICYIKRLVGRKQKNC